MCKHSLCSLFKNTISEYKESTHNAGDQGREDPLEKEMATHSSILTWRIPWTEKPGGLWGHRVGHD